MSVHNRTGAAVLGVIDGVADGTASEASGGAPMAGPARSGASATRLARPDQRLTDAVKPRE